MAALVAVGIAEPVEAQIRFDDDETERDAFFAGLTPSAHPSVD